MKTINNKELSLVFLRTSIGIAFVIHGFPKLLAGTEQWFWLGEQLQVIGISFTPTLFGFMAVLSEFLGGLLLTIGVLQRWSAAALLFTMFIALLMQLDSGATYDVWSHPLKMVFVFTSLVIAKDLPNLFQTLKRI